MRSPAASGRTTPPTEPREESDVELAPFLGPDTPPRGSPTSSPRCSPRTMFRRASAKINQMPRFRRNMLGGVLAAVGLGLLGYMLYKLLPTRMRHGCPAGNRCPDPTFVRPSRDETQARCGLMPWGSPEKLKVSSFSSQAASVMGTAAEAAGLLKPGLRATEAEARALVEGYAKLHRRMMDPHDKKPKRFYVANSIMANSGNRAMGLVSHLVLAIMSGRALVYDGWLPGFDFPIDLDYQHVPGSYGCVLRSEWEGSGNTEWLAYDPKETFCDAYQLDSLMGNDPLFYWTTFTPDWWAKNPTPGLNGLPGALDILGTSTNVHHRAWIQRHIGDHVRVLTNWFLKPDPHLMQEVLAIESKLCGGQCELGVHIRRGKDNDLYFPLKDERAEIKQFATCAERVARAKNLGHDWKAYVASDTASVVNTAREFLGGSRTRVADVTRACDVTSKCDDMKMRANMNALNESLKEVFLMTRTKYFIGTRFSTFSMLVASMREDKHFMVYPGVYDECLQASSPFNSLSRFEQTNLVTSSGDASFSIYGRMGQVYCIDQEMINDAQALGGTFNPHTETLQGVLHWDKPTQHPKACARDYTEDCPELWNLDVASGLCHSPKTYLGNCGKTLYPKISVEEKQKWAFLCSADWPCKYDLDRFISR